MRVKPHRYAATVRWSEAGGGPTTAYASYAREHRIELPGKPPFAVSADPHFRGDPALPNPEELLVAALASCHLLSWLALCARAGIAVLDYTDAARGEMTLIDGRIRFREVVLAPRATIADPARVAEAQALHGRAHEECFIANSVNFPVRHEPVTLVLA